MKEAETGSRSQSLGSRDRTKTAGPIPSIRAGSRPVAHRAGTWRRGDRPVQGTARCLGQKSQRLLLLWEDAACTRQSTRGNCEESVGDDWHLPSCRPWESSAEQPGSRRIQNSEGAPHTAEPPRRGHCPWATWSPSSWEHAALPSAICPWDSALMTLAIKDILLLRWLLWGTACHCGPALTSPSQFPRGGLGCGAGVSTASSGVAWNWDLFPRLTPLPLGNS